MTFPELIVHVEGSTDVEVVARMLAAVDATSDIPPIANGGKQRLLTRLPDLRGLASSAPVLVVRDLDHDAPCAPTLVTRLVPIPAPFMSLRIAVRAAEAWLLSDRQRMARFLRVSEAKIPARPDGLEDPKRTLVDLARRSTKPDVVHDMVPGMGRSRSVGPGYESRLVEFATRHWRPDVARRNSDSLDRALRAIEALAAAWRQSRQAGDADV